MCVCVRVCVVCVLMYERGGQHASSIKAILHKQGHTQMLRPSQEKQTDKSQLRGKVKLNLN